MLLNLIAYQVYWENPVVFTYNRKEVHSIWYFVSILSYSAPSSVLVLGNPLAATVNSILLVFE